MFSFLSWDFGNRPPRRNDGGLKVRPMVSQLEARDVPSVVYDNGFQGATTAGGEWTARAANGATVTPTISTTPVGNRQFLGQFGNSTATLSLADLPTHNAITISFDLYVINSWDGSDVLRKWGPDGWSFAIDGQSQLTTTFSNQPLASPGAANNVQSFGGQNVPAGSYPAFTGASEVNSLGYKFYRSSYQWLEAMDSVYRLEFTVPHVGEGVRFDFRGFGLQGIADESWGLDNVRVEAQTHNVWDGVGLFSDPSNWSLDRVPIASDVVVFDGDISSGDCLFDLPSSVSSFEGWRMEDGYAGIVSLNSGLSIGDLFLESGRLDQPVAAPLSVRDTFVWTGGTLNGTETLASLHLDGGSMARIAPGAGNAVSTGSSITFGNLGTTGSSGTFSPGIVEFANGAGVSVGSHCAVEIKARDNVITFTNVDSSGKSLIAIKKDGKIDVVSGVYTTNDIPIQIDGGILNIRHLSTAKISGTVDGAKASVYMTSGQLNLSHGSTLEVNGGCEFAGGILTTSSIAAKSQPAAKIDGKVKLSGADIVLMQGENRTSFGVLFINGDVEWSSGVYRPVIKIDDTSSRDLLFIGGSLSGGEDGSGSIDAGAVNAKGEQVIPPNKASWPVVEVTGGLSPTTFVPNVPNAGKAWFELNFGKNTAGFYVSINVVSKGT